MTELPDRQTEGLPPIFHKYSSVLDNAAVGIFQTTPNGGFLRVNQTLARIYGYASPAELTATVKTIGEQLYVETSRYGQLMGLLQKYRTVKNFDAPVYRQDGSIIWVRQNIRVMRDRSGRLLGYQGTVEQIAEPKTSPSTFPIPLETEKQLNSSSNLILSMISHEVRASLTVISAANDLLKLHSQNMTPEQRLKYFEKINATVKTTTELLEGFLTVGKAEFGISSLKLVPVSFSNLCQDLWQDVEKITGTNHHFVFKNTGDSPTIIADPTLLRQIILNLLINAVKYSPRNSTILCDCTCANGKMIFCIQDRGIGIPPEDLENLFQMFHRAKNVAQASGTGLGLAIVKRAVELLGGKIRVESQVGVGTTFTVTLPRLTPRVSRISDRPKTA